MHSSMIFRQNYLWPTVYVQDSIKRDPKLEFVAQSMLDKTMR